VTSVWDAYLDIETTGLSPSYCRITVIGIYLTSGPQERLVQLVGDDINDARIMSAMQGVKDLYTYNGHRFDLPFIHARYGVDLENLYTHCDLMNHCWRHNLHGGLKKVEQCLGIERKLKEVNGLEAIRLWWRYANDYDQQALSTLLEYNKEDVVNLKILRERLVKPH
jgi:uncharacterized protein